MKGLINRLSEMSLSDDEIRYMFDENPNLTMRDLARKTGKTVKQLKRILREDLEMSSLEEANPAMRNFKSSYWWFDDLSFIRDHHLSYVIVGDGRMELSPKRAGLLSKKGYIDIVEHPMGRRASLTREGKKKLSQAQDIYDGLVEGRGF